MPFSQFDIIMNGDPPAPIPHQTLVSEAVSPKINNTDIGPSKEQKDTSLPDTTRSQHPHITSQPSIIYNHQIQQYSTGLSQNSVGPYQINFQPSLQSANNNANGNTNLYSSYLTYGNRPDIVQPEQLRQPPPPPPHPQHQQHQLQQQPFPYSTAYPYSTVYEPPMGQTLGPATATQEDIEDQPQYNNTTTTTTTSSNLRSSVPMKQFRTRRTRGSRNASFCDVCQKTILRDMKRHLRIHEDVKRFVCVYPRDTCVHKTGSFNRNYDFKKHLLHSHFDFDDHMVKKLFGLNEKLSHKGTCPCGLKTTGGDWLDNHILTDDEAMKCPHLKRLWADRHEQEQKNKQQQPSSVTMAPDLNLNYASNIQNEPQQSMGPGPATGYGGNGYYGYATVATSEPAIQPANNPETSGSYDSSSPPRADPRGQHYAHQPQSSALGGTLVANYSQQGGPEQMQPPVHYQPYITYHLQNASQQPQSDQQINMGNAQVYSNQSLQPSQSHQPPHPSYGSSSKPQMYHQTSLPMHPTTSASTPGPGSSSQSGSPAPNYNQRPMSFDASANHPQGNVRMNSQEQSYGNYATYPHFNQQHTSGSFVKQPPSASNSTGVPGSRSSVMAVSADRTSIGEPLSSQQQSFQQQQQQQQQQKQPHLMNHSSQTSMNSEPNTKAGVSQINPNMEASPVVPFCQPQAQPQLPPQGYQFGNELRSQGQGFNSMGSKQ